MFQSEKHGGSVGATKMSLRLYLMYLSWACTQCPPHFSLTLSFCVPLSLSFTHSGSNVLLCNESLSYAVQGPPWVPSLGSQTKQRRWCYLNAARRLSACIGPGWPSGLLADACWCQAPSAFSLWTSAVCGKAVEFVCGCILILHLFSSSHAWPSKPAALLALLVLIALAWLAVCLWLHSLISIPLDAPTTVAAFRQTHTHIHSYALIHTYMCCCEAWQGKGQLSPANEGTRRRLE